jgi:hypothetical protein
LPLHSHVCAVHYIARTGATGQRALAQGAHALGGIGRVLLVYLALAVGGLFAFGPQAIGAEVVQMKSGSLPGTWFGQKSVLDIRCDFDFSGRYKRYFLRGREPYASEEGRYTLNGSSVHLVIEQFQPENLLHQKSEDLSISWIDTDTVRLGEVVYRRKR